MSSNRSLDQFASINGNHPNPQFTYLQSFLPRRLKDLFELIEYVFYNSPHIFAAVEKFSSYPITEIQIHTEDEALEASWEKTLKDVMKIKSTAIQHGLDMHLYGNAFASIYKPFDRFLICPNCSTRTNVTKADFKYQPKTTAFSYACGSCKKTSIVQAEDRKAKDSKRVNIVRWNPKHISIQYHPITGERQYYYEIPKGLKKRVEENDQMLISTMPMSFLKAMAQNKNVMFGPRQLYHSKLPAPAGAANPAWGMPPITALLKMFFYVAALRRANEAIALDHVAPLRVLHPAAVSGNGDPVQKLNLGEWRTEMEQNIKQWRVDPAHIAFAPVALGVTMVGGQARSLMTHGEIKEAEGDIIAGLGIPREFLYGGLSFTGSSVTLRMLENQFETYLGYLNDFLTWVVEETSKVHGLKKVKVSWAPFRLVDDVQQKQTVLSLHSSNPGQPLLSNDTLLKLHDMDYADEQKKIQQERLDSARAAIELQQQQEQISDSLAAKAQQEAASGVGLQYDTQAIVAQGDQLAQQLMGIDEGQRRSIMSQLSQEDAVMYAVVKDRLDTHQAMSKGPQ